MKIGIYEGEASQVLRMLPAASAHCCVTSPPYWSLRDYGHDQQVGLELSPGEYVQRLVAVFREVRRVLRDDGTCWVNIGDTYAAQRGGTAPPADTACGHNRGMNTGYNPHRNARAFGLKHKDLVGIPHRLALALQADGWYWRADIIWHKPSAMPERVTDRPMRAHEHVLMLSKRERYAYHDKRRTPNVWAIRPDPMQGAHQAVMPLELARRCIVAGAAEGETVIDPFAGTGTTAIAAHNAGRRCTLIELSPDYAQQACERIREATRQQSLLGLC